MKRLTLLLCLLAILVVALVAALPLFVSSETVRTAIHNQLEELTGREVSFRGNPSLSLQPFLAIEIDDLQINDSLAGPDDPVLIQIETVQTKLDIFSTLSGNLRFSAFQLLRPQLNLKRHANGESNWRFKNGQFSETHQAIRENLANPEAQVSTPDPEIGAFTIIDGVIRFEDAKSGVSSQFTSVNGQIDWPTALTSLEISGTAIWHGESVKIISRIEAPMVLLAGGETSLGLALTSAPLELRYNGSANMLSDLFLRGSLTLSTPSTRRLSELLDTNLGDLGSLALTSEIEASAQTIRLSEASVEVAENPANGALTINFDEQGNSRIGGTLAFEELDFSRLITEPTDGTSDQATTEKSGNTSIDLRVSANSIDTGFAELSDVAALVTANEDGWSVEIGESTVLSGNLIAMFGEKNIDGGQVAFLDVNGENIDSSALSALFEGNRITFSGPAKITAKLKGSDIRKVLKQDNVMGSFDATIKDGAIQGIDLQRLLAGEETKPGDEQQGADLGNLTRFDTAMAQMFISDGIVTFGNSEIRSGEDRYRLFGLVSLNGGSLSLRAREVITEDEQPDRLFIGGTLKDPLVSVKPAQKADASSDNNTQTIAN